MSDHPTLTDVEKAIGETLMAGRMLQHVMGVNKNEQLSGYVHMEYVDAALAERDALIMRLAGERDTARETNGQLAHNNVLLLGASKRNLDRAESLEDKLRLYRQERGDFIDRAEQAEARVAELEKELVEFRSLHTAAGCGMDAATGSLHVMTTGVKT
jgi:hypothetical protein